VWGSQGRTDVWHLMLIPPLLFRPWKQGGGAGSAQTDATASDQMPPATVTTREQLQLGDVLGHGSWGTVFRGAFAGVPAAIKVFYREAGCPGHGSGESSYSRELAAYARLQAVQKGCVPALLGHGQLVGHQAVYFLALSSVPGRSLTFAHQPPIPLQLAEAVVAAVQQVHGCGVLHGDLENTANMLVSEREGGAWQVTIVDFGCSKLNASRRQLQAELKALKQVLALMQRVT
jgi:serine/threonine protein kinase